MKLDCNSAEYAEVRDMAVTALIGIVEEWGADGHDQTAALEVVHESGEIVCRVSITLQGDWLH